MNYRVTLITGLDNKPNFMYVVNVNDKTYYGKWWSLYCDKKSLLRKKLSKKCVEALVSPKHRISESTFDSIFKHGHQIVQKYEV